VRVVWSPLAITRAAEAAGYIAQDRPAAAERWVRALFETVRSLSRFPERGRQVPEVGRPDIREIFHGEYRIIYRLDARRIAILTVRHGRRQFDPKDLPEVD
jgi:toxin ParE1/3/4